MAGYRQMNKQELLAEKAQLEKAYAGYQAKGLKLNMARGKPGAEQLAISMPMLDTLNSKSNCKSEAGVDCRNYGELTGIAEARALFGEYMGIPAEQTLVMGSASLTFMYDCVARAMLTGVLGSEKPWGKYEKVKFLCPVPGYDRHFTICEFLGIEMINIPLTEWGPDVELIQKLVAEDDSIKGMWCVPKYTNPLGGVYSDEAVRALANLKPKAKDFRIFWDNAYAMHYIYRDVPLLNIIDECAKAGNPDRVYVFGSTSKITFPGAGVAFFGASKANVDFTVKQLNAQAISWDKLNMLRHVRYFKNLDGIRAQMELHAQVLRPKFDAVLDALDSELTERGVGRWVKPEGGYFVTYIAESGCATRIVGLCKQAGVVLTEAGATHPYHKDPDDAYIRIAPSFPSPAELANAMEIFCLSARLAMVEKLLG
ncbi:MAG: aminotransferase class I/II-fold pyridoxal phosphate-dependent enzyme [Oscillospiraceae bacterium]